MGLPKDERKTLAFYYQNFLAGKSSFKCKEPMDEVVDRHLRDRGLIKVDIDFLATTKLSQISLTPEGIRLGQKYNSWWLRSNLWYEEHLKNHWIWVIIGFLGGVISGLLIKWLATFLIETPGAK
jgi:hypothetical protein